MSYTWYTVGLLEDLDYSVNISQINSSSYSRTTPYYVLYNSSWNSVYKINLPEQTNECWAAAVLTVVGEYSTDIDNTFFALKNLANTVEYASLHVDGLNLVHVRVMGVQVGSFQLNNRGVMSSIETHLKLDAVLGVYQVWQDGVLVVDYTGSISTNIDAISIFYNTHDSHGNNFNYYMSDIVLTNQGKIGSKRPIILALNAPGDLSPSTFYDKIGNSTATDFSWDVGSVATYILGVPFNYAGTISQIRFRFKAASSFYVGIFTKTGTNIYTKKYMSNLITSGYGEYTGMAGLDIPNNWTVTTNDYIGIYLTVGILCMNLGGFTPNDDNFPAGGYYSFTGDGLSDGLAHTYSVGGSTLYWLAILAQYQVTDTSVAYNMSLGAISVTSHNYLEKFKYAALTSAGDGMIANLDNIPIDCASIKSVRITTKVSGSDALNRANVHLKIDGVDTTNAINLPTAPTLVNTQIDGNWTPAQVNAAQIGVTALDSL